MTTETITLSAICPGGNHLTFTLTGAKDATCMLLLDDALLPISDDDIVTFCKIIARMAKAGRTPAQARTLLQAGVTVTV